MGTARNSEDVYTDVTSESTECIVGQKRIEHDLLAFITDKILGRYGKEMTWEIKAGCMGKRELTQLCTQICPQPDNISLVAERPSVEYLLSFFPDVPLSIDEYIEERRRLQDESWPNVKPLPGVVPLVKHLVQHRIPIAVATGSIRRNYVLKTGHLAYLFDLFGGDVVCGDDEELRGKGKPMPDVFLVAARKLGRTVGNGDIDSLSEAEAAQRAQRAKGLVFEDATNGVQAGKRAGMKGQ